MDPYYQSLREENENLTKALAFLEKQLEITMSMSFSLFEI